MKVEIKASDIISTLGSIIGEVAECGIKLTGYAVSDVAKYKKREDIADSIETTAKFLGKSTNLILKASSIAVGKATDIALESAIKGAIFFKENAYKKEVFIDGDFYGENKIVDTKFEVK